LPKVNKKVENDAILDSQGFQLFNYTIS